jgi:hypothetical protein
LTNLEFRNPHASLHPRWNYWDLASQPTLSRFENAIDIPSRKRLRDVLIDPFIASFEMPPVALPFDLDAVDDPTHGSQQRTLFPGFDGQDQYLPRVTSADTDPIVLMSLRPGGHRLAGSRRRLGISGHAGPSRLAGRDDPGAG